MIHRYAPVAAAFERSVEIAASQGGPRMMDLMRRLFPICRSLLGAGTRETLRILSETIPLQLHEVPTGTAVLDWTVPNEWSIRDAYIADIAGRRLVDFKENNLHVLAHSAPVHRRISRTDLEEHLHSLPAQPDAIPYLTTAYEERWGFCVSQMQREALTDGEYDVAIDSSLFPGQLCYADVRLPGTTDAELLFSTYVCHPSMANDNLSGPVLLALLYELLKDIPDRRYSIRFVFVPETLGAVAYLAACGEQLKSVVRAGYVVTCVGDDAPFTYKSSRRGNTLADMVARHDLRHVEGGAEARLLQFFPTGSDERQYCSTGYDLPVGSLMRSMYGTYPQYHTSLDDLDFVSASGLTGSLVAYLRLVEVLELCGRFVPTVTHGEPQMARYGLYPTLGSKQKSAELKRVRYLLGLADGNMDLIDVAERAGEPAWSFAGAIDALVAAGLLAVSE